eukprot:TRINITY_DN93_c0_g1_i1.p1 TRINITY_DN93_c0_g1~~TRINITY_DN93_c0_g1_i1.p1  ORF type:complete len:423 (+),score=165.19 TRINITY_DN93_c0_g1_i1:83-1351(+)
MSLVIHSYPGNARANKALIAAKYVGAKVTVNSIKMGEENKTPEFLKKNPFGKVPVMDTPEGPIFESNAIARYVARSGDNSLYGANAYEAAQVEQWMEATSSELDLPAMAWLLPIFGMIPNNPQATAKAQQDVKKFLAILDNHLLTRTYLVGNGISLADIVVFCHLTHLFTKVIDTEARKPLVNLTRWFVTLQNQPNFKEVTGEITLCAKAEVAPAAPKKEEKPKAAPKAEAKKEEKPKPAAKPKKDEEDDGEENYADEEPKAKNPLDLLPKSTFIMDEWKRVYSNQDTRSQALPWFWQNLDKAGYCMYWCDYKYNTELSKVFMTSNLVGGFFQRLEKLHKYAFGSMLILGEEPKLALHGVWLFRGSEIPADMTACDDSEHYTWTPVKLDDENQKRLVEDYFAWDSKDSFGGKGPFVAGKVYK